MKIQYSMVIQWSDEDQVYIVSLPEFGEYSKTHGKSYRSAVKNGQEFLELLIETYQEEGRPLPQPNTYCSDSPAKRRPRSKPKAQAV
jgi:predicted RNase H-like HicB family nuclease